MSRALGPGWSPGPGPGQLGGQRLEGLEEVPSGSQFRCCSVGIDVCRGTLV